MLNKVMRELMGRLWSYIRKREWQKRKWTKRKKDVGKGGEKEDGVISSRSYKNWFCYIGYN